MTFFMPTCDDADRPAVKTVIHGATAVLYLAMFIYHGIAAVNHWCERRGNI